MPGNVYVFNATANNMTLFLNDCPLNSLNGVTPSNGYAPLSLTVPRNPSTDSPGNATFGGKNKLIVSFAASGGTSQEYEIDIPSNQAPIASDLQLYIFFNEVVLLINGAGQNIPYQGSSLSTAQVDRITAAAAKA